MSAYTLTLPYPISANRYWRSFVPRGSQRAVTVVSDEAKAYREEVKWRAMAAGLRPLSGRIEFHVKLYPGRPQDWEKRRRKDPETWDDSVRCIDLGNAEKVLSDALNDVAWHDDDQLRRIVLERMTPDENGPRVVVVITQLSVPQGELVAQLFGSEAA